MIQIGGLWFIKDNQMLTTADKCLYLWTSCFNKNIKIASMCSFWQSDWKVLHRMIHANVKRDDLRHSSFKVASRQEESSDLFVLCRLFPGNADLCMCAWEQKCWNIRLWDSGCPPSKLFFSNAAKNAIFKRAEVSYNSPNRRMLSWQRDSQWIYGKIKRQWLPKGQSPVLRAGMPLTTDGKD